MRKRCLNIGCGENKVNYAVNIDIIKTSATDKVCDVNKGIPFDDGSFDLVLLDNVFEHLDKHIFVLSEIHRVLSHGGRVIINVPHYSAYSSYNLSHTKYFSLGAFNEYVKGGDYSFMGDFHFRYCNITVHLPFIRKMRLNSSGFKGKVLNTISNKLNYIANINPKLYERLLFLPILPIWEIEFELIK